MSRWVADIYERVQNHFSNSSHVFSFVASAIYIYEVILRSLYKGIRRILGWALGADRLFVGGHPDVRDRNLPLSCWQSALLLWQDIQVLNGYWVCDKQKCRLAQSPGQSTQEYLSLFVQVASEWLTLVYHLWLNFLASNIVHIQWDEYQGHIVLYLVHLWVV